MHETILEYFSAKDALAGCQTSCDSEDAHLRYKRAEEALRLAVARPALVERQVA